MQACVNECVGNQSYGNCQNKKSENSALGHLIDDQKHSSDLHILTLQNVKNLENHKHFVCGFEV